jgi:hypothetical protein
LTKIRTVLRPSWRAFSIKRISVQIEGLSNPGNVKSLDYRQLKRRKLSKQFIQKKQLRFHYSIPKEYNSDSSRLLDEYGLEDGGCIKEEPSVSVKVVELEDKADKFTESDCDVEFVDPGMDGPVSTYSRDGKYLS